MQSDKEKELEQLIDNLLDRHGIDDILEELCCRASHRRKAFEMVGDRVSAQKWDEINDMLELAVQNIYRFLK